MKNILFLILIIFNSNLFAQNNHPSNRITTEFDKLTELAKKTDSLIEISNKMKFPKIDITEGISEGSIKLTDSLNVEIGSGGFTTYTFINETTNKIIKAEHNQTIHYGYDKDNINGNTERIEISIYYNNEKAYYAEFNESHYNDEKVISTNRYYLQLDMKNDKIFYSNSFQEKIVKYIMKISENIISNK